MSYINKTWTSTVKILRRTEKVKEYSELPYVLFVDSTVVNILASLQNHFGENCTHTQFHMSSKNKGILSPRQNMIIASRKFTILIYYLRLGTYIKPSQLSLFAFELSLEREIDNYDRQK